MYWKFAPKTCNLFYVLAGWEGLVLDARILRGVISHKNGLKIPQST